MKGWNSPMFSNVSRDVNGMATQHMAPKIPMIQAKERYCTL